MIILDIGLNSSEEQLLNKMGKISMHVPTYFILSNTNFNKIKDKGQLIQDKNIGTWFNVKYNVYIKVEYTWKSNDSIIYIQTKNDYKMYLRYKKISVIKNNISN